MKSISTPSDLYPHLNALVLRDYSEYFNKYSFKHHKCSLQTTKC